MRLQEAVGYSALNKWKNEKKLTRKILSLLNK